MIAGAGGGRDVYRIVCAGLLSAVALMLIASTCTSEACGPYLPGTTNPGPLLIDSKLNVPVLFYPTGSYEGCDYEVMASFENQMTEEDALVADAEDVDAAAEAWTFAGAEIGISGSFGQPSISINFKNPYPDDRPNTEFAYTTVVSQIGVQSIIGAYVHYNYEYWYWPNTSDDICNFRDVLRHEFGHCLNFNHDDCTGSNVMCETTNHGCNNPSVLSTNEEEALKKFYPTDFTYGPWQCCKRGGGPAAMDRITAAGDSAGVLVSFGTSHEQDVAGFAVSRLVWSPSFSRTIVDTIACGAESREYCVVDPVVHDGAVYEVASVGANGIIDGVWYTGYESVSKGINMERRVAEATRASEIGTGGYWEGVRSGSVMPAGMADKVRTEPVDYVVFAYEDFVEEVAPLCAFWEGTGLAVVLVPVDDSAGRRQAIRDIIRVYHALRPLQAVLLVGDACENNDLEPVNVPANAVAPPPINHIPTFYEQSLCYPDIKAYQATDIPYGDVDDDGVLDVPIGRLPADSESEVSLYVAKVLQYMSYYLLPANYGRSVIHCVPTTLPRCELNGERLSEAQAAIKQLGRDLHALGHADGEGSLELYDTTELLIWTGDDCDGSNGNDYYSALARDYIGTSVMSGAHVILGVSEHFGSFVPYSLFGRTDWASETVPRSTMNYWFWFQCLAGNFSGVNGVGEDYQPLCEYELFEQSALMVIGPNGPSWNELNSSIARRWVEKLYHRGSNGLYDGVCMGQKYKECFNELMNETMYGRELRSYMLLGDPMLRMKDPMVITGEEVVAGSEDSGVSVFPNPCNARLVIRHDGRSLKNVECIVYSMRGEVVCKLDRDVYEDGVRWVWDGEDSRGRIVPSGTYVVRVSGTDVGWSRKVVLLK